MTTFDECEGRDISPTEREQLTMTMFANRVSDSSPNIKVSITYGPVSASVEENYGHLRGFHTQLGQLLDEVEAQEKAKIKEV